MTSTNTLIALVDCNNFYVSCERVFRPDLQGKPVAVMSNNDGCIIARSQEVKALGIKMGTPVFQLQPLIKQHAIHLFSSNYPLYADMSARVMSLLQEFSPMMEIYSIDEAFLTLTALPDTNPITYAQHLKKTVYRATGIPVSVGIGSTKTLAKLASFAAKKWPQTQGVVVLTDTIRREKLMKIAPVHEVWGIGTRTATKLNALNINSAWDLANQSSQYLQSMFNITVARTAKELQGISCLTWEESPPDKQQLVCSRSFKRRLTDYHDVAAALAEFCTRAAEKLRFQHSTTQCISIFTFSYGVNSHCPPQQTSATMTLQQSTQDTRVIIHFALLLLKSLFKQQQQYQKCGVQLTQLQSLNHAQQYSLFTETSTQQVCENRPLMTTMDKINQRFPKKLRLASTLNQSWQAKAEHLSPAYTTQWQALVKVKCQ
jgi:DNA polymerase V